MGKDGSVEASPFEPAQPEDASCPSPRLALPHLLTRSASSPKHRLDHQQNKEKDEHVVTKAQQTVWSINQQKASTSLLICSGLLLNGFLIVVL